MKIIPAIDLHEGKCVRLYKGDYHQITEYGNPIEAAKRFKAMGATLLHLVDLDGAKEGKSVNLFTVQRIIQEVGIDCELGGGIREIRQIEELLKLGVKRVILGSAALNLRFVQECIVRFGKEKIVIGIDCKNMKISTHGWLKITEISALDFAAELKNIGVETIIFTDIAKDGTLEGINISQTRQLIEKSGLAVIASGGAKSMEDIQSCREIGCAGIILGKSIYSGAISLAEAIERFEGSNAE